MHARDDRHRRRRLLTESQGFSAFVLEDGSVYHTYSTGARGVEFLMGYDYAYQGDDLPHLDRLLSWFAR
jgi:predicted dithiol-disulfide oxidoreductase (DUF899 family)